MITIVESGFVKSINQKTNKHSKFVGYYKKVEGLLDLMINNPIKNGEKGKIPAFIFSKFIDESSARIIENVEEINNEYIGLDFDEGITINEFIEKYKQYKFWLYTTSSHSEEHNKFRVIMKCNFPKYAWFDEEERRYSRQILGEIFTNVDIASFGPERLLYVPNDCGNYFSLFNDGEDLDITEKWRSLRKGISLKKSCDDFVKNSKKKKVTKENKFSENASYDTCMKQSIIKDYMNTYSNKKNGNGDGENILYRALSSLKGMNACDQAIDELVDHAVNNNSWNRKEVEKKIQVIWSK